MPFVVLSEFEYFARIRALIRTFQYLLLPTGRQQRALSDLLRLSAELNDAALQERADAWRRQ
jgi:hypothetical protein